MSELAALEQTIRKYKPTCQQEAQDRQVMLNFLTAHPDCLLRSNRLAHFTASSWILDESHAYTLLVYHNIYRSWSWTGGHADGGADLLAVALREAREETGLTRVQPLRAAPLSLEIITVDGHIKKGRYVSSHLHMNLTYLLQAPLDQPVRSCPEENQGVRWVEREQAPLISSEPWMAGIYRKLNQQAAALLSLA